MNTTSILEEIDARCADPELHLPPEATTTIERLRPTSIQLSRWRVHDRQRASGPGMLKATRDVLHVELRSSGQRRSFATTLPAGTPDARLDGLPWLDVSGAEPVPALPALLDLVCAARRAGAEISRWDPQAIGSPPRPERDRVLPRSLVLGLTLGRIGPLVALAVAGVALFVAIILSLFVDVRDLTLAPDTRADARIVDISRTHTTINNHPLLRYHVVFETDDATTIETTTTDWGRGESIGDVLPIEYDASSPSDVRPVGRDFGSLPWFAAAIPLGIGALALLLALVFVLTGSRRVRLLRRGHITLGTLVDTRPTAVRINNRPVVELCFEFTVDGRRHVATGRTSWPRHYEMGRRERVFYDRTNPDEAMLVDDVKTPIDIDDEGHVITGGGLGTPLAVINGLLLLGCLGELAVVVLVLALG